MRILPPLVAVFLAVTTSTGSLIAEQARELRQAAKQGDADAQFRLGDAYFKGEDVEQDYVTAAAWWHRAGAQGHAPAQYNLGRMYQQGRGVSQDYAEAVAWYRRAADRRAVARDRVAVAAAQYQLGVMYATGQGVAQNDAAAFMWYRRAAEQGDAFGQLQLGVMYGLGRSVPQDYVAAHIWLNLAAAQGNETARQGRDLLAEAMTPEQVAEAQRRAKTCLAARYRDC